MARNTKTKSAPTESVPAPAAVESAAAPSKKVVSKASKSKEVSSAPAQTSVVVPVAVVEPVATQTSASETIDMEAIEIEAGLNNASLEFLARLNSISSALSSLKNEYRVLEKKWSKELKTALKACSKRKKKAGNRAPSGFVKPTRISDELANFLSKPIGTEMARTEVTREINDYIRKNSLQDKDNGRKINADTCLSNLLKLSTTDELTYFNLQKFMSPHFAKGVPKVVSDAV
jgi:upstream activation factor subunit UAF30